MKNGKKLLSILLAALLIAICVPVAFASYGTDGNLDWEFKASEETLIISGYGTMNDYDQNNRPGWYGVRKDISTIIIEQGVTSIGSYAFEECATLWTLKIPGSVKSIGDHAFSGCYNIRNITIPEGVKSIGAYAFAYGAQLKSVTIPVSVTKIGDHAFFCDDSLETVKYVGSEQNWSYIDLGSHVFDTRTDGAEVPIDPQPEIKYNSSAEVVCKWCGETHTDGFFQKLIAFFHNIFAAIFGAKY